MRDEWSGAMRDSLKWYGLGRAAASVWRRGQAVRNRKGRGAPPKGNGRVRSDGARSRVGDAVEAGLTVVDRMVASGGDASQRNGKGNVVDGKSSKPVFPELHRSHAAGAFAAAASVANTFERTLIPGR